MNLYMIRRSPDLFISDAYAYAIVAAETGDAAKHTHPDNGIPARSTWSTNIDISPTCGSN